MVLGIIGATLGILAGLRSVEFEMVLAVILALGGAALARKTPTASWIILLVGGILSFLAAGNPGSGDFMMLSGVFLIAAAILEFIGRKELKDS